MNDSMKEIKKIQIAILKEVVRICDLHNISYFLVGGTLLGAIRHKGYIPWDDDIDIAMPRDDYNKFKSVCKAELDSKMDLCDWSDSSYYLLHAKVRCNDTIYEEPFIEHMNINKGIFIDVFVLDNAIKQESIVKTFQAKAFKKIAAFIRLKNIIRYKTEKTFRQNLGLFLTFPFSAKLLIRIVQKIMTLYNNKQTEFFVNFASSYGHIKQTMKKSIYFPAEKAEFEGKVYNVPNGWDYFLERIYGDYMKLPDEKNRTQKHITL